MERWNVHKYLSRSASDCLAVKSWLISDEPLHSAISASSVPVVPGWTLSLVKHPESESLTNCWDSITWAFAKPESSAQPLPSWPSSARLLTSMVLETGLSGLSISTSLAALTTFLGLLLRGRMNFGLGECAATQVVLTGWGPGELDLLDFCPLEQCVWAVSLWLPASADSSSPPADPQSIDFWDAASSCVLSISAQSFEVSCFSAPNETSSFPSVEFAFGTSFSTSCVLTSEVKLKPDREGTKWGKTLLAGWLYKVYEQTVATSPFTECTLHLCTFVNSITMYRFRK